MSIIWRIIVCHLMRQQIVNMYQIFKIIVCYKIRIVQYIYSRNFTSNNNPHPRRCWFTSTIQLSDRSETCFFTGNCEDVTYYISGSIVHKFLKFLYLDYHSWYILPLIFNIILVHLIFEMPPRKKIKHFHTNKTFGLLSTMENSKVQLL